MKQLIKKSNVPRIYHWILNHVLPESYRESAIGDLAEEYCLRKQSAQGNALIWLTYQTLRAVLQCIVQLFTSGKLIQACLVVLTFFILPTGYIFVCWLSSMDGASPALWQPLLTGEMHKIVVQSEFWQVAVQSAAEARNGHMFVNDKALLWACVSIFALFSKRAQWSVNRLALVGMGMMLLPYVWVMWVLHAFTPELRSIGPLLAFTLFCFLYLAVPVTAITFMKKRQAAHALAKER